MNTPEINNQSESASNFNPDLPKNLKAFLDFERLLIEKFYGFTDLTIEQKSKWIIENAKNFREKIRSNPQILQQYVEGINENDESKIAEACGSISDLIYVHA